MAKLGILIGGTRYAETEGGEPKHSLDLLDLDAGDDEPGRIALDFLAHGFALHPKQRTRAALLEKRGPGGAFVDVAAKKLLEKHEVDEPRINTGHIAMMDGRAFAVVSAPRDGLPAESSVGGVSLRPLGGAMRYAREPKQVVARMLGESLSVC